MTLRTFHIIFNVLLFSAIVHYTQYPNVLKAGIIFSVAFLVTSMIIESTNIYAKESDKKEV